MVCSAARRGFCFSSLVAQPLGLSCGFSPTSVYGPPTSEQGSAPKAALEHWVAPVRTGRGGGTAAGVSGALAVTGALGIRLQLEIWPCQ